MSDRFPARVLNRLEELDDAVVLEWPGGEVTAAGMLRLVRRVTAALRSAGAGPGSGVAFMPGVTPVGFAALLAVHLVGTRVSGVRPGLTAEQLAHLLDDRVGWAVVDASTDVSAVVKARPDLVLVDLGPLGAPDVMGLDEDDDLTPRGRPEDVARVTYTSGSTGNPKGAAQTYAAFEQEWPSRAELHNEVLSDLGSRLDRYLLHGTLNSVVMVDYALVCLVHGGRLVIPSAGGSFAEIVERHRITGSIVTVPKLLELLSVVRAGTGDVSSLKGVMVSGSPLDPRRYAEALELLGPIVFQGYGQTECGLISMLAPSQALASENALTSVGRPLPRNLVETRDGEIYVRTPQQTIGYVNEGDIVREQAEVFTDDGWIRTRDLGGLDGEGFLHLSGRARDVIIVNANVQYAGPIERALASHPAVDQAYVVGVPDPATGEAIEAFVVLREDVVAGLDDELRRIVGERLGEVCVPRAFTVIDAVPLTSAGKPDKNALRLL
ncbi:class I adenylate-forming enzyme family protein [Kineosporia succinea]|uniref:Acyl-CoA synthetase (AMP-forming)/AMP-acid ligase II n=1 Tax=Kineosporia succinea TaxID=84632 RepID=A0ABT9NXP5_9ACTN|nr:class I adenylate-forming enzyme family protein [Kineosporia succinea]MDP9824630.1 acyl-CoA synthetase (AMP-forming)/AMP-acid ligase II [Kineosporia succinea]